MRDGHQMTWLVTIFSLGAVLSGAPPGYSREGGTENVLYEEHLAMRRNLVLLKAFQIMPMGDGEEDFGRRADIQIAENLVVKDVPVEFIEAATLYGIIQSSSEGHAIAGLETLESASDLRAVDGRVIAESLVAWWTEPVLVRLRGLTPREEGAPDPEGEPSLRKLLQADAVFTRDLKSRGTDPGDMIDINWFMNAGGGPLSQWQRKPLSFQMLLERFDPGAPVEERNARSVAEELAWTKHIGLTEGTFKELPDARRVFQALLLERLGFEIGNPADRDRARRAAAREKLAEAMSLCAEIWEAGAAVDP